MKSIKTWVCALALTSAMAGGAVAEPLSTTFSGANIKATVSKILPSPSYGGAIAVAGGTFAAWTVYRFFQGCGPFRCPRG